jgi:transposase-like protein
MREMSVAQQRYEAVRAVIADGETVTQVAARFGVSLEPARSRRYHVASE